QRVAIVGSGYGGYSALFALGHNPELYRCGISINGITDWVSLIQDKSDPKYKFSREYWTKQIGDPKIDEASLRTISPVSFAEKMVAPVLVIHGMENRNV